MSNLVRSHSPMKNIQKTVALVFGIAFLLIGILGFVPALTPNGMLLGLFMVNLAHNLVHLLFGVVGLAVALTDTGGKDTSRLYNRVSGVIYLVLLVVGLIAMIVPALAPNGMLLGLVAINPADNILHLVLGGVLAYVGFGIHSSHSALQSA